jgi:hypothetical protein
MEGMTTLQYTEKHKRDDVFHRLRCSPEPNERQVIRYSNPVPTMINEEEFKLDEKGRVVYKTAYFLAYPNECTWKRLKENA